MEKTAQKIVRMVETYAECVQFGELWPEFTQPRTHNLVASRDVKKMIRDSPESLDGFRFYDRTAAVVEGEMLQGEARDFSPWYYPDGIVYTINQVKSGEADYLDASTAGRLRKYMLAGGIERIVVTRNRTICPFNGRDMVIGLAATARNAARE